MPQGRSCNSHSSASRSLSVSSDSDTVEEPKVLEEARKGSAAAKLSRGSKGGFGRRWRRSKGSSSSGLSGSALLPHRNACRTGENGSREPIRKSGSVEHPPDGPSRDRPTGVSFMDELRASLSSASRLLSHHTAKHATSGPATGHTEPMAPQIAISSTPESRARAVASANRNISAMAAERRAFHEAQSPVFDAIEVEIRGFHRQLDDVKESLHKRCMSIFNSFVGSTWTIDTSDTLAKRMLRPVKWSLKTQEEVEAQESTVESKGWFGPSAIDVFGDSLVVEERNPYRIVGVFARRYWDTRRRLPYLDDLVCSTIFPCLQFSEPVNRPQLLQVPFEPPRSIKAFGSPASSRPITHPSDLTDTHPEEFTSAQPTPEQNSSRHPDGLPIAAVLPPLGLSNTIEQALKDREDAFCTVNCPKPFSRYVCVVLPVNGLPRSSPPASYPRAPVEINNMRIPSLLSEYLQKNCVTVERPAWDRSSPREPRKVTDAVLARLHRDETDSSCDEDEQGREGVFESKIWGARHVFQNCGTSSSPQFFRREVCNRWLPTIFSDVDVRISEYWKLKNMEDREKAAWVYQGLHTEPNPRWWEDIPMEGKSLSRKEIAQQRKLAASRRRVSRDAERLLRDTCYSSIRSQSSADDVTTSKRGGTPASRDNSELAGRRERSENREPVSSRATFPKFAYVHGLRAVRRVR